jgi:hypothetical protein
MEHNLRVWRWIAESGARERERATAVGRTVHHKLCTSTLMSYRVVEIISKIQNYVRKVSSNKCLQH